MPLRKLRSGRVVIDTIRDRSGRAMFHEIIDISTQARRTIYGAAWYDPSRYDKSVGPAASEEDVPELIEHCLEIYQTHWMWPNAANKKLIFMPHAFAFCVPRIGDRLRSRTRDQVFTVKHVGDTRDKIPWAGSLLLDEEPQRPDELSWFDDGSKTGAATRNYVSFIEADGELGETTPGEENSGDTGIGYRKVALPTVTYLLERQQPGSITPQPFGSRVQPKPRIREQFPDPLAPGQSILITGQFMDNLFRFDCLHPRAVVANRLARWLRSAMQANTPTLCANGIPQMYYLSQTAPERRKRTGDDTVARTVRFFVRTEELEIRRATNLRHLNINVGLVALNDLESDDHGPFGALQPLTGFFDATGDLVGATLDIADQGLAIEPA